MKKYINNIKNRPFISEGLLGIMIIVYLYMLFSGNNNPYGMINYGANVHALVADGEYWRFLTAIFLHWDFMHILFNGITLYFIGVQLESFFGHTRFLLIFLLSGIMGNMVSFAFSNNSISAGASTSLFGLFGVYLMLGENFHNNIFIRSLAKSFSFLIILNIGIDLMMPNVDMYGHIGGLIGGFLYAYVFSLPNNPNISKMKRVVAFIMVLIISVSMLKIGFSSSY
ncbi:membrane-associated serine protease [Apilactobacillus ozensis DSM 23829 = JCM 17196]|uniref:Membrane-associated serine protease n=2 Tax=Apilactobacillus ozensis TaxID=866801 RepID=A0A0R2AMA4_9LACO|nr:rhomboid family intramembrane serine protease [Apilactobacillus ozensis]KRM68093.1 membrane-associated serine protease [Apilactobacillus ozensis DSM 23829 = JCM 17196]